MIRYQLQCPKNHRFEAWFKSSADFDRQSRRKLMTCPTCGATNITKAMMAPNVRPSRSKGRTQGPQQEMTVANADVGPTAEKRRELMALMRKLRREVERNAEYVGPRFAEEARKMHFEETDRRGIFGEATLEEARGLEEDGIEFYPLPRLPEDQN